ncbi:hypothetical protein [Pseudalkalibacillus caeni]|uniref:hypothetical protein n=1 Tax=Exobacillus caeni TaxID=2574798 RepID=UPI0014859A27|nr:hypothetical protein [Pseudalkalibacillus caeni]
MITSEKLLTWKERKSFAGLDKTMIKNGRNFNPVETFIKKLDREEETIRGAHGENRVIL